MPSSAVHSPSPLARWRTLLLALLAFGVLMLCASVLVAGARSPLAAPSLRGEAERTPQGVKIALAGAGWPARTNLALTATAPPGASEPLDLGTTMSNANGELRATKLSPCSTQDSAVASRATVTVTASTTDGAERAEAKLSGDSWVCVAR